MCLLGDKVWWYPGISRRTLPGQKECLLILWFLFHFLLKYLTQSHLCVWLLGVSDTQGRRKFRVFPYEGGAPEIRPSSLLSFAPKHPPAALKHWPAQTELSTSSQGVLHHTCRVLLSTGSKLSIIRPSCKSVPWRSMGKFPGKTQKTGWWADSVSSRWKE